MELNKRSFNILRKKFQHQEKHKNKKCNSCKEFLQLNELIALSIFSDLKAQKIMDRWIKG